MPVMISSVVATMDQLRVLLVEDEFFVSMVISEIIESTVAAVVVVKSSVEGAEAALADLFHLALLDVDVTNGKTYSIAKLLNRKNIPYAFVSGSDRRELPEELQNAPFIPKPFEYSQIERIVLGAEQMRRDALTG